MRAPTDEQTKEQVKALYEKIHEILKKRGLRWIDLSALLGVKNSTFSSMKSQNQVPSIFTVKKIAEVLDVSMDELFDDSSKTQALYDLYWEIPRILDAEDNQSTACEQLRYLAYAVAGKDINNALSRDQVCTDESKKAIDDLKV